MGNFVRSNSSYSFGSAEKNWPISLSHCLVLVRLVRLNRLVRLLRLVRLVRIVRLVRLVRLGTGKTIDLEKTTGGGDIHIYIQHMDGHWDY